VASAVKDRSYRATPLGLEVARYIRWKRNEWGATDSTIRDYEAHLRNLALFFADLELKDLQPPVGIERVREVIDHYWGTAPADAEQGALDVHRLLRVGDQGGPRHLRQPGARDREGEGARHADRAPDRAADREALAANPYEADWLALN
jgi:hypothetical protein